MIIPSLFSALATTLALTASMAHADVQPAKTFKCTNLAYREARFELNTSSVLIIEDTYFDDGLQPILEAYEKANGFPKESLVLVKASLEIPQRDLSCSGVNILPLDCQGQSEGAMLRVTVWRTGDPSNSQITFRTPVQVSHYKLQAKLTNSDGPITLGSKATTVKLDKYVITVDASLELAGTAQHFKFASFFHTSASQGVATCQF